MFGYKLINKYEYEELKKYQGRYTEVTKKIDGITNEIASLRKNATSLAKEQKDFIKKLQDENEHLKNVINGYKGKIVQFKKEK